MALAAAACGDATRLPQAPSTSPFTTQKVAVRELGNAPASIDSNSVTYLLDASRSLVVTLRLTSRALARQTVTVRGSLYDSQGNLVGDVTGSQLNVSAGSSTTVRLNGPAPLGTIASVTFEVSEQPMPS